MTTKKPRTQVYTVTTTETTARVMKIRAATPEEALERADDTADDYTHTEPGPSTVEDEQGQDVTPEDDEPAELDTAALLANIRAILEESEDWGADELEAIALAFTHAGAPLRDSSEDR